MQIFNISQLIVIYYKFSNVQVNISSDFDVIGLFEIYSEDFNRELLEIKGQYIIIFILKEFDIKKHQINEEKENSDKK